MRQSIPSPIQMPPHLSPMALAQQIRDLQNSHRLLSTNIMEFVKQEVAAQMKKVPAGKPGLRGLPAKSIDETALFKRIYAAVLAAIPTPEDGKDGKNGESADPETVAALVLSRIQIPDPEPAPKVGDILSALKEEGIDLHYINGLDEKLVEIRRASALGSGAVRGGGDTVAAGSGVSISQSNGVKTISVASGTIVSEEVPSGSGTSFTIAHTPTSGTFKLYRGGARQQGGGADYTLTGTALTLTTALVSGEVLLCDYSY